MDVDTISVVDENEVNFDHPMDDVNEAESQVKRMANFGMGMEIQISSHARQDLDKRQRACAVVQLCYIVHSLHLLRMMSRYTCSATSDENSEEEGRCVQLMTQLVQTEKCRDIICMGPQAFLQLCQKLRSSGRVKDSTGATVEGQVAVFLHILGRDAKNQTVPFLFHLSRETVNRIYRSVLRAVTSLHDEFLVQPSGADVPPQILNNNKFYPYFKDCVGAIGGTHIRVKVPIADAPRFCGRKGYPTTNVFAACNFDMKFTYVLAGWEGSASDSRILEDALSREDSLKIPEGKFYIGNARFVLKHGVLAPYRGVRYHLKEYSTQGPQNYKELFNLHHSLLQNVIERTFGVLKKRFPIIASDSEPFYSFLFMRDTVISCCVLHNFLIGIDIDEQIIAEVDRELLQYEKKRSLPRRRGKDYRDGENLRKNIALEMWNAHEVECAECITHVPSY